MQCKEDKFVTKRPSRNQYRCVDYSPISKFYAHSLSMLQKLDAQHSLQTHSIIEYPTNNRIHIHIQGDSKIPGRNMIWNQILSVQGLLLNIANPTLFVTSRCSYVLLLFSTEKNLACALCRQVTERLSPSPHKRRQ